MDNIFIHFSNPIILGLGVAILMAILVYFNKKITKEDVKKTSIYKIVISSGLLSGGLLYLSNPNSTKIELKGSGIRTKEINTDNPDDW